MQCVCDVFGECQGLKSIHPESPFAILDAAKTLDESIDACGHTDTLDAYGHGFILEQIVNSYLKAGWAWMPAEWMRTHAYAFPPSSQRALLALSRCKLMSRGNVRELFLVDGAVLELVKEAAPESTGNARMSKSETFFCRIGAFFNCILNQRPVDLTDFQQSIAELCRQNQRLTERLWMETIVLAGAALPRNDPRCINTVKTEEPAGRSEVPFTDMTEFLMRREAAFSSLLAIIQKFASVHLTSVPALDNFQEDLSLLPHKVSLFLTPPQLHILDPLLDHLRVLVPHLHAFEVSDRSQCKTDCVP